MGLLLLSAGLVLSHSWAAAEGMPPLRYSGWSAEARRDKERVFAQLQPRLQAGEKVRLLIQLHVPFAPEGSGLSRAAVSSQRRNIAQAQANLSSRLSAFNSKTLWNFRYVPLMLVEVDSTGMADLIANPHVAGVQEDVPVPPTLLESTPLIGADLAWLAGFTGAGQTIAILDTGVDAGHAFFQGRVVEEACFSTTGGGSTSLCPNGLQEQLGAGAGVHCDLSVRGCDHGTHVAGIAAGDRPEFSGVAPDAQILAVQVFSRFDDEALCGAGNAPCAMSWTADQIRALEWVYAQRLTHAIASANMSLGGGQYFSNCDTDSRKPAIDNLRSAGIATVIATGNSGFKDSIARPACISSAISVGASTGVDSVASFSNVSSFMSLLAPGSMIYSSVPGNLFAFKSGTSMAAPHVAGAWAVLKSKAPGASVDEVLEALRSTGILIDDTRSGGVVTDMPRIQLNTALDAVPTGTVTPTPILSATPSPIATPTATALPSNTPTAIPAPTNTPIGGPSPTPTTVFCEYEYAITDLGTLGGSQSNAADINDFGQVVGSARNASGSWRAFLWQDGLMTDLGTLGGSSSYASGINNAGQITGGAANSFGETKAFLWQSGTMTDLGTLGGIESYGEGINELGQVVGAAEIGSIDIHAFLWDGVSMTDLGDLGSGDYSWAYGVNDSAQVVGESALTDWVEVHAFLYTGEVMSDLGTIGAGEYSYAFGINNAGQVVGYAYTAGGAFVAYVYEAGVMNPLPGLGGTDAFAEGINDSGQIVGRADDPSETGRAVLWQLGQVIDLNARIPPASGWLLTSASAISGSGQIVGTGVIGGQSHAFLLTPTQCISPTPGPTIMPTATASATPTAIALPSETPSPTPTATLLPSPTPTAMVPGDLNGDGVVDVLDVQLCVNVVLGLETDPEVTARADVNGDGQVDVLDVQTVVNMFLAG